MKATLVASYTAAADTTEDFLYAEPRPEKEEYWMLISGSEERHRRIMPLVNVWQYHETWAGCSGKERTLELGEKPVRWEAPKRFVDLREWAGVGENYVPHRQPIPERKKIIPYKKPVVTELQGLPRYWYIKKWVEQPRPTEVLKYKQAYAAWVDLWKWTDIANVKMSHPEAVARALRQDLRERRTQAFSRSQETESFIFTSALTLFDELLREGRRLELDALEEAPEGRPNEALALGLIPSADLYRRVVIDVMAYTAALSYVSGVQNGLAAVTHLTSTTIGFGSLNFAIGARDGVRPNVLAEFAPEAVRSVIESFTGSTPEEFLRAVRNETTNRARAGHRSKKTETERYTYSMYYEKPSEDGVRRTLLDRFEDPEGDPADIIIRRSEMAEQRELVKEAHEKAHKVLTDKGLSVWTALFERKGHKEEQEIAAELGLSKSSLSHIKGRSLERVRGALEEAGYDRSVLQTLPKGTFPDDYVPEHLRKSPFPPFEVDRSPSEVVRYYLMEGAA